MAMGSCGRMDVDIAASDSGNTLRAKVCCPSSRSAFEGVLPECKLLWFRSEDVTGPSLGRIMIARRPGWEGDAYRLILENAAGLLPKLRLFKKASRVPKAAESFSVQTPDHLARIPPDPPTNCLVVKVNDCA